jgi:hypothetical protein
VAVRHVRDQALTPRAERPWWRTILVVTAVSSMNTSRGAVTFDIVPNRGKESAENPRVK